MAAPSRALLEAVTALGSPFSRWRGTRCPPGPAPGPTVPMMIIAPLRPGQSCARPTATMVPITDQRLQSHPHGSNRSPQSAISPIDLSVLTVASVHAKVINLS